MNYKGIELKEITKPQIFDPPKKMLVWDHCANIVELDVYAIVNRKDFRVICEYSTWKYCAEIPGVKESKLVTYRELSNWLAKGNGEIMWSNVVYTGWRYINDDENKAIKESLSVRKWEDTEWHNPTMEYLGLEEK